MTDTEATRKKAVQCALRLLGRREYAQLELNQKLDQKGFSKQVQVFVLSELIKAGYQSDSRYVSCFIRHAASRGRGPLWITNQLRAKGISKETIQKGLNDFQGSWVEMIQDLFLRRFGTYKATGSRYCPPKAFHFLQQRGFSAELITQALQL